MLASGQLPPAPGLVTTAWLDMQRTGQLHVPLLDWDAELADEFRLLDDLVAGRLGGEPS